MRSRSTYIRFAAQFVGLIGAVICFLGAAGCDRARAELDDRSHVLDARAAIATYADRIPATYPAQERWITAMKALEGLTEPAAMQRVMTATVSPALIAYADVVSAMSDVPPTLLAAHRAMAEAHRTLGAACRAFAQGLDRRTYAAHRADFTKAIIAFNDAQRAYSDITSKVYADVGVDVMPPPPLAAVSP